MNKKQKFVLPRHSGYLSPHLYAELASKGLSPPMPKLPLSVASPNGADPWLYAELAAKGLAHAYDFPKPEHIRRAEYHQAYMEDRQPKERER